MANFVADEDNVIVFTDKLGVDAVYTDKLGNVQTFTNSLFSSSDLTDKVGNELVYGDNLVLGPWCRPMWCDPNWWCYRNTSQVTEQQDEEIVVTETTGSAHNFIDA